MHNTVKAGLSKCESVKTLHSKMRRILEFCHKSPVQLRFIKGNAKWLGLPELTVKSECPTRWNSFMVSCERFIVIYDPLNVTLSNAEKDDLILTADDLSLMKELVTELMPFRDITNMLCVNTTYSFNNYLPMVDGICRQLEKKVDRTKSSQYMVSFREHMRDHFRNFKLGDRASRLAKTAALMDPKLVAITPRSDITVFMDNVVKFLPANSPTETQDIVESSQPPVNLSVNVPKAGGSKAPVWSMSKYFDPEQGWAPDKKDAEEVVRPKRRTLRETVLVEADNLFSECYSNKKQLMQQLREGTYDCATWWRNNHKRYPKLAIVAKNLLCIPATSANCEREFSTLTDVVTNKRNRLHAATTRKLTFLKHNLLYMPKYSTYRKSDSDSEETAPQGVNVPVLENYELDQWIE